LSFSGSMSLKMSDIQILVIKGVKFIAEVKLATSFERTLVKSFVD